MFCTFLVPSIRRARNFEFKMETPSLAISECDRKAKSREAKKIYHGVSLTEEEEHIYHDYFFAGSWFDRLFDVNPSFFFDAIIMPLRPTKWNTNVTTWAIVIFSGITLIFPLFFHYIFQTMSVVVTIGT